ncbi:MAG: CDP-alcohol phosphatidyltransferase family protein [Candidatus Omnitrophica bacterium]|nr:CDP-alcohol phosphatidyltransferase family protein [Candidatus Omnitrophota bacterium]
MTHPIGFIRFNRRCSSYVIRALAKLPVTPNQVTLFNLGVGLLAMLALAQGKWWSAILGAFFLEVSYILDNCDGELARMRGMVSLLGRQLDTLVDTVIHVGLFPAMAIGVVRQGWHGPFTWVGCIGGLATLVIYIITLMQEGDQSAASVKALPAWHGFKDAARTDYALLVLLCASLGWLPGLLWVSVIGVVVLCAAILIHVVQGGRII